MREFFTKTIDFYEHIDILFKELSFFTIAI